MKNKNIELYIYDRDLNFKGVIDNYTSLRWRRKYFEAGEFELHLQATKNNISFFKADNIIAKEESEEAGFIQSVEIIEGEEDSEIIVVGRFLSYLLYRRIVKRKINFSGKILDGMRKILNEMTPFKILKIEKTNIDSAEIDFQVTYKNVYNKIHQLSLASNIGFRIIPDFKNKEMFFQNYVGLNRSTKQKLNSFYEFSEEYSNIEKSDYLFDSSSICNYVLVGGEGEGDQRALVTVDNTAGLHDFDIVETFIDEKETRGDLTENEYKKILKQKGNEYIKDITKSINFDVYAEDYKKKWNLGDITTIKKKSWDIEEDLRIIEVEEVIEDAKITITPVFGTPLAEKYIDDND